MAAWTAEQVAELGKLVSLGWSSFEIASPPPQGSMTFAELPNSLTACRWPYGNPHDLDTFRYCGVGTEPGQSYCRAHQAKAWGRS